MACAFGFVLVLCSLAAGVLAADGQAFVGLNGNGTNLVLDPPHGGQVVVDGVAFRGLLQDLAKMKSDIAQLQGAQRRNAAFRAQGLYAIAGSDMNGTSFSSVESFNHIMGGWTSKPALPVPTSHLAASQANAVVYAHVATRFFSLEPGATEWQEWTFPGSQTVAHSSNSALEIINNTAFAIGCGVERRGHVFSLDLTTKIWTRLADMPTPRYAFGSGIYQGTIVCAGGYTLATGGAVAAFERFYPAENRWETLRSMQVSRFSGAGGILNDHFYMVNGHTFDQGFTNSVERYDFNSQTWEFVASTTTARIHLGGAVFNGFLYVFGGSSSGTNALTLAEKYDPSLDRWTPEPSMSTQRALFGSTSIQTS